MALANYNFFVSQTNKKDYKRYDLFKQMSAKIFAELVEKIIFFKDKTVTLVLKIDNDLNSYFDKKSIDLSNFTLILPPKSLKFEESKRKIKISPNEENPGRDSIEASNNHRMYRLTKWPTAENVGDTNDDWFSPNNIKANQKEEKKKTKNIDEYEIIYTFSIINTKSKHFKYVLSKQLEEVDPKKRYNGKYIYPIKQFIFLFQKNNKIIVPIKLFVKKS